MMDEDTRRDNELFEAEVRRIARELWSTAGDSGPVIIDGRERDGIFETEECIHLIEATTSRRKEKAQEDVSKLVGLALKTQKRYAPKATKCWFITREDPTAVQRAITDKHAPLVTALSFSLFQHKLIDAKAYLSARDKYPFGSVRDPGTDSMSPKIDYIPLDLLNMQSRETIAVDAVLTGLAEGQRYVILGDYGAGKSMTLRHLYQALRKRHLLGQTATFPIYLNLRDHFGQSDPAEILERHAKTIGFPQPYHLVRAWRAGYVVLLLDGFDEVTTIGIQGLWKKLQDNRYRAMEPVRRFVRGHPSSSGIILAGRAHFFDSERERRRALDLTPGAVELTLVEFTDEQIRSYLEKVGLTGSVPRWLPSRPLLVGYLAAKGLLQQIAVQGDAAGPDPARGWDQLLDAVAEREAQIEAGIDGRSVRRILERLATSARRSEGGLGPLSADDIISAFRDICGYGPDERGMVLLQRLPGLGIDRADEETRAFIDEDFADACRAGDVLEFISHPYEPAPPLQAVECALGTLGVSVAASRAMANGFSQKQMNAAAQHAVQTGSQQLSSDVVRVALGMGHSVDTEIYVRGVLIPELECGMGTAGALRIWFQDCFFTRIGIDPDVQAEHLPRFKRCYIGELDGRLSKSDLPTGVFEECEIEDYTERSDTTSEILALDLPLGTKVLLTVLKKLYQRRGSGRKESALRRGLDHRSRRVVDDILRIIEAQGLGVRYKKGDTTIWLPDRAATRRVGRIVASPNTCTDPVLREVVALG